MEVARAARLGHKMPGMANVYEHVTPQMKTHVLEALDHRWRQSLTALSHTERQRLVEFVPEINEELYRARRSEEARTSGDTKTISQISPTAG